MLFLSGNKYQTVDHICSSFCPWKCWFWKFLLVSIDGNSQANEFKRIRSLSVDMDFGRKQMSTDQSVSTVSLWRSEEMNDCPIQLEIQTERNFSMKIFIRSNFNNYTTFWECRWAFNFDLAFNICMFLLYQKCCHFISCHHTKNNKIVKSILLPITKTKNPFAKHNCLYLLVRLNIGSVTLLFLRLEFCIIHN